MNDFPALGHGIGLRPPHYPDVLAGDPEVDFLEVITENFLVRGGNPRRVLRKVRERWPVVLHGVSLSLGGPDELDEEHLAAIAALAREIEPAWISDHLCWSGYRLHRAHDLWPLPFTEESVRHTADRIARVQDRLGRRILVENVSTYVRFAQAEMPEHEFVAAVLERADCGLLLDVNNVYVNSRNFGFDPVAYLEGLPLGRVGQIHLAGHSDHGTHLLDTHDHPVPDPVWDLHRTAVRLCRRPLTTLVEWDDHLPPLERVVQESRRARAVEAEALAELAA